MLERALARTREEATAAAGEVLEGLALASYLDLDFARAVELWERAYAVHREANNQVGAVRVAPYPAPCTS